MRRPNNNKLGYIEMKYNKARDDKVRFSKIKQKNKVRREKIKKK
jgi:hypothetical protein